ncbi:hypothetical protein V5O48_002899 [Marasmius crinis-equi]|uniref:FAM192A/Fyv6 N-terminal domain-containing protein n=1 Tax=Marasmius crinis-equi TaxID=585013 RepID=A0ABR3FUH3_9AGAR
MEETAIPSLSSGAVGSRFVSSDEIETAKARREEQWKAAYARYGFSRLCRFLSSVTRARLGQEPPPQQVEDNYDGRSLAEKLAANRQAKQEEWEEKTKLANQFRALEEDEIMFLDSVREKQEQEERVRKERDGEEVKSFKEAVAARTQASPPNPLTSNAPPAKDPPAKPAAPPKKDVKKGLKGVVIKKKANTKPTPSGDKKPATTSTTESKTTDTDGPAPKRRRISES